MSEENRRVLFVAFDWRPVGGLERYNRALVSALTRVGLLVDLAGVWNTEPLDIAGTQTIPLAPLMRIWQKVYRVGLWKWRLRRYLQKVHLKYDLVIIGHLYLAPSYHQVWSSAGRATPYWVWTYGREAWGRLGDDARAALLDARTVGTISEFTAGHLRDSVPGIAPMILHNPVDVDRFRPSDLPDRRETERTRPRLLTVARLAARVSYKGHRIVMDAVRLLRDEYDLKVDYWIAGSGDGRSALEEYAKSRGVADLVRFLGYVPDSELVSIYQSCDIFIMPSAVEERPDGSFNGEGLGYCYVEAAACALPVIASNQGGARETVIDGVTGYAVDPRSPRANAEAIVEMLRDSSVAEGMGKAGRCYAVKEFSAAAFELRVRRLVSSDLA